MREVALGDCKLEPMLDIPVRKDQFILADTDVGVELELHKGDTAQGDYGLKSIQDIITQQGQSDTVEQVDGSPMLRRAKRALNISPSTPIGFQRKHQVGEDKKDLQIITFNQDIEMLDLDSCNQSQTNDINSKSTLTETPNVTDTPGRRLLRGLRRGTLVKPKLDFITGLFPQAPDTKSEQEDKGVDRKSNFKGTSLKILKQRNKEKVKNYKTTRKKNKHEKPRLENNQPLINEFFSSTPVNNNTVVGLERNVKTHSGMPGNNNKDN